MIAIMSAMEEEIREILKLVNAPMIAKIAEGHFILGKLTNKEVIVARSKIGKIAASITGTIMFDHFKAGYLIFTGVAVTPPKNLISWWGILLSLNKPTTTT